MALTTTSIINEFAWGAQKGKASSLIIEGDKLFNYGTVIAQRVNGVIVLNVTRYSQTTTTHQNRLKREFPNVRMLESIPMGCSDLERYL